MRAYIFAFQRSFNLLSSDWGSPRMCLGKSISCRNEAGRARRSAGRSRRRCSSASRTRPARRRPWRAPCEPRHREPFRGSFSSGSTPIFASKYAFFSMFRELHENHVRKEILKKKKQTLRVRKMTCDIVHYGLTLRPPFFGAAFAFAAPFPPLPPPPASAFGEAGSSISSGSYTSSWM